MNKLKKIFVVFLGVLFIFIGGVCSKPVIENVSGNFSHKSSLVIYGEGFGLKNVSEPEIWDTVDNIDDYNNISDGYLFVDNTNPLGPWQSTRFGLYYRTDKSRTQRNQFSTASYYGDEDGGVMGGYKVKNGEDLYFSWWWNPNKDVQPDELSTQSSKFTRYGSIGNMGGILGSWRPNQHTISNYFCNHWHSPWLWDSNKSYDKDDIVGWPDSTSGEDCQVYRALTENSNVEPPNESYWKLTDYGNNPVNDWPDWEGTYGEWNRLELYFDNSEMKGWAKTNGKVINEINWYNEELNKGNYPKIKWANMIGLDPSPYDIEGLEYDMDDIYVDSTLAKIELCNKSNWTEIENNGSHCEIQIPQNWSKESIKTEFNQGVFKKNDTAYLFVVDENGSVNEQGYPINISGETPAIHPADTNYDGTVSFSEINNYIDRWLDDEITIDELLSGINKWRGN